MSQENVEVIVRKALAASTGTTADELGNAKQANLR
jgi:hypothetical protein